MKLMKKIAPIAAAFLMLGATAAAADLGSWKSTFGGADTAIVLGADAATADNIGAINIATALTVTTSSGSTTSGVAGETIQIEGAGTDLNLGDVFTQTFDNNDLDMLADGNFNENEGDNENDVDYDQFLEIDPDGVLSVAYQENTEDTNGKAGMYAEIADSEKVYAYTLNFNEGVEIDDGTNDGAKTDMLASELTILGKPYTITDVELDGANEVDKISMLSGAVDATQSEYSNQTYVVDGKSYTVEVVVITTDEAKFKINGQVTDALTVGQTDEVGGIKIGVREVLENEGTETGGQDQVSFYLGARSIVLDNDGEVTVNDEDIDSSLVTITSTNDGVDTTSMTEIKIETVQDGDDVFLEEGKQWKDPVFDAFGVQYTGLDEDTSNNVVEITTASNSGSITFKNSVGDEIELSLDTDAANAFLGDDSVGADAESFLDKDEPMTTMVAGALTTATDDHYFIVTTDNAGARAHLFKIDKIVEGATDTVTVKDITADVEEEITTLTIDAADTADTTLFGDWNFQLTATAANTLAVGEGAGNGEILGTAADAVTAGGMIKLENGATLGLDTTDDPIVYVSEDGVRTAGNDIQAQIVYTGVDTELQVLHAGIDIAGTASPLEADDDDSNDFAGYSTWGAKVEWNDENYDVTITSPEDETIVLMDVITTGSSVTHYGGSVGGSGPTPVEDSDWASAKVKNVIVVGGSGINKAAADLLGLTYPTYGSAEAWQTATGVSGPGIAVVKMLANPYATGKYAMLVAGWDGIDTQKAALALKEGTPALTGMIAKLKTSTATVELMA